MKDLLKIFADDAGTVKGTLEKNLPNTGSTAFQDSTLITNLLNWGYAAAGLIAVGFIIYGGWKYMSANGEPDRIKSASMILLYSIIGLVVVLLAAAITNFVIFNVGSNV